MNRLSLPVLLASGLVALLSGCTLADTDTRGGPATPTPDPTPIYSNETYAKALKTASYRLRGLPPIYADTQAVRAGGQAVYTAKIDEYLDFAQNPLLGTSIRAFYRTLFMMGTPLDPDGAGPEPVLDYDQVPNLATYLVLNDLPVTGLVTADYCVAAGTPDGGQPPELEFTMAADCVGGAPLAERAGVLGNKAFLQKFGAANTVNMRRVSIVHQVFACGIYPDPDENPPPLARTNTPEAQWPINNSGTEDPADDFPDPGEGYNVTLPGPDGLPGTADDIPAPIADPAGPLSRLHKKYQSKLPSQAGARCHDCHGQLNARRPVFTAYDFNGNYVPGRSIGGSLIPDGNVESPAVNGNQDYCGLIGDTDNAGGDDNDNMVPPTALAALDCLSENPPAQYLGQPMATLKDFGAHIVNRGVNDRFYTCMATRHYNFVLGKSQGELSMQAAGGSGPPAMAPATLQKYSAVYESSGWNSRELIRVVFKSNEFLSSQGSPINPAD